MKTRFCFVQLEVETELREAYNIVTRKKNDELPSLRPYDEIPDDYVIANVTYDPNTDRISILAKKRVDDGA